MSVKRLNLHMLKCHIVGNNMGRNARKPVARGLRTTQAQTKMLHQIKAQQFYTNFLVLISPLSLASISEVEF